ncbi:hypothetical protein [Thiolinea disciformis]|uniref:hypothetical protein n=1 Tax=Thiolinea disciformis TaxID=125614 RepID=UPI000367B2F3|nr:hypothetical protein [Thiolinea disciformis]
MSEQLFDLVITGHDSHKTDEALVSDLLDLLNDHSPQLEYKLSEALLFSNNMVAIRERINIKEANALRQRLNSLAVHSDIRPTLQVMAKPIEAAIYTCPACGHQQTKQEEGYGRYDVCEACGIVGERYNQKLRMQEVMISERQRYENEKSKSILDALAQAKLDEENRLREEARRRLGLLPRSNKMLKIIAGAIAGLVFVASFGVFYSLKNKPDTEASAANVESLKPLVDQASINPAGVVGPEGKQSLVTIQGGNVSPEAVAALMQAGEHSPLKTPSTLKETEEERHTAVTNTNVEANEASQGTAVSEANVKAKAQGNLAAKGDSLAQPQPALGEATPSIELVKILKNNQLLGTKHTDLSLVKQRERVAQLLKLGESDLAALVVEEALDPYHASVLLLDIAQWELQNHAESAALQKLDLIQNLLSKTRNIDQQVLVLGVLSHAQQLTNQHAKAAASLASAIEKIRSLPKRSVQADLLVQLAQAQALLGNAKTTRQILKIAEPLLSHKATHFAYFIATYMLIGDLEVVKKQLSALENLAQREKLSAVINDLENPLAQGKTR